jgi:hypothetical protein
MPASLAAPNLEAVVRLIRGWLEAEPLLDSRELMERLVAHKGEHYSGRKMHTLQRGLRGHRLRRIEVEMTASDGRQGNRDEMWWRMATDCRNPDLSVVLMRPASAPRKLGCHRDQNRCRLVSGKLAQTDGSWSSRTPLLSHSGLMLRL